MSLKQKIHDTADNIKDQTAAAQQVREGYEEERAERRLSQDRLMMGDRAIMTEVRMIGGALVTILIIALVLTEVYDAVEVQDGPFSSIVDDLESTGVAAMSLLIVGLLVVAASAIMRLFGSTGFGGR